MGYRAIGMDLRVFYGILRWQVGERDSALEAARALARAVLAAGAVLLGIMVVSLGNLALFVLEMHKDGAVPDGLPWQALALITVCSVAGLGFIIASVAFSVRALTVPYVRYAISSRDFSAGGDVDMGAVERIAGSPDNEMYADLIVSCVKAIRDREKVLPMVGARTSMAQKCLLAGVLLAGGGVMAALPVLLAAVMP